MSLVGVDLAAGGFHTAPGLRIALDRDAYARAYGEHIAAMLSYSSSGTSIKVQPISSSRLRNGTGMIRE